MNQARRIAVAVIASLGIGVGAAHAHSGQMGDGMGRHMTDRAQHGAEHGTAGGVKEGTGPGAMMRDHGGPGAGHQLMTSEERTALREKMRDAATPEERQQIAATTRAEMQKRTLEKGTPPEHRGPRLGRTPRGPGAAEHAH